MEDGEQVEKAVSFKKFCCVEGSGSGMFAGLLCKVQERGAFLRERE